MRFAQARTVLKLGTKRDLRLEANRRANFKRQLRIRTDPEFAARIRAYQREYRRKHAERLLVQRKAWVRANQHRLNAYSRRYYEMNPWVREYHAIKQREYRAARKAG